MRLPVNLSMGADVARNGLLLGIVTYCLGCSVIVVSVVKLETYSRPMMLIKILKIRG